MCKEILILACDRSCQMMVDERLRRGHEQNSAGCMGNGLSMEKLKDILWPIILVGGFGAFIDFLIGKAGQVKAKDFLLKWWVRFDDVRWRNFGREEGIFAGHLIEKSFGRRIWSRRRIGMAFLTFFCCG